MKGVRGKGQKGSGTKVRALARYCFGLERTRRERIWLDVMIPAVVASGRASDGVERPGLARGTAGVAGVFLEGSDESLVRSFSCGQRTDGPAADLVVSSSASGVWWRIWYGVCVPHTVAVWGW